MKKGLNVSALEATPNLRKNSGLETRGGRMFFIPKTLNPVPG